MGEFDILLACKSPVYALLPWAFTLHRNAADGLDPSHRFVLEQKFTDTILTSLKIKSSVIIFGKTKIRVVALPCADPENFPGWGGGIRGICI